MRRLLVLAGLVAAVAVAGGAAHGATRSARADGATLYEKQMKVANEQLASSLALISKTMALSLRYPVRPTAARQAAALLSSTRGKLRQATKRLRAISPPAAARVQHAKLVAGTIQLRSELLPIIARLKKGYLIATAHLPRLTGTVKIVSARAALKKHGYSF